jgi:hypothetical protein
VLTWAEGVGLGRYSFWDVNRDLECNPPDNNGTLSGTCSSVTQNSWDFTKYDAEFAGATPPVSTSPTATASASRLRPDGDAHRHRRRHRRQLRGGLERVELVQLRRRGLLQRRQLDREPVELRRGPRRRIRRLDQRRRLLIEG